MRAGRFVTYLARAFALYLLYIISRNGTFYDAFLALSGAFLIILAYRAGRGLTGAVGRRPLKSAANPAASPGTLLKLASSRRWGVRMAVASNTSSPREALAMLGSLEKKRFRDSEPLHLVNRALAANPSADSEVLASVACCDDWQARNFVAQHPNASQDIISTLSSDSSWETRSLVAERSDSPGTLSILAEDMDSRVRSVVASNNHVPPGTLSSMASDLDWLVRSAVVQNSSTPEEALLRLAVDRKTQVRELALARLESDPPSPECLSSAADSPKWGLRTYVAGHESTPVDALERLYSQQVAGEYDPEGLGVYGVMVALAGNKSTPPDVLARIAYSEDNLLSRLKGKSAANIRKAVAANPSAPSGALSMLLRDVDPGVREAARLNTATPLEEIARAREEGVAGRGGAPTGPPGSAVQQSAHAPSAEFHGYSGRDLMSEQLASAGGSAASSADNALARWSLGLGLAGYFLGAPLVAAAGLVCGHVHLSRTTQGPGSGRGLAISGLVAGYITWFSYLYWTLS